jgi:toxin YhaV
MRPSGRSSRPKTPRGSVEESSVVVNGWTICCHPLFLDQFETLANEVEALKAADPKGYRDKKKTKLLSAIITMGFEIIPSNPADRRFYQGNTLGTSYRHWHRGKFFEGRFRLFFRYSSSARVIVLAWVNDSETLRTYGSKTDAYAVFKKMLGNDSPPDDWDTLMKEAATAAKRQQRLLGSRGKIEDD